MMSMFNFYFAINSAFESMPRIEIQNCNRLQFSVAKTVMIMYNKRSKRQIRRNGKECPMSNKQVTIYDIAREAGVSIATVSG